MVVVLPAPFGRGVRRCSPTEMWKLTPSTAVRSRSGGHRPHAAAGGDAGSRRLVLGVLSLVDAAHGCSFGRDLLGQNGESRSPFCRAMAPSVTPETSGTRRRRRPPRASAAAPTSWASSAAACWLSATPEAVLSAAWLTEDIINMIFPAPVARPLRQLRAMLLVVAAYCPRPRRRSSSGSRRSGRGGRDRLDRRHRAGGVVLDRFDLRVSRPTFFAVSLASYLDLVGDHGEALAHYRHRAASMRSLARHARRLVCWAMPVMTLTIWPISAELSPNFPTTSVVAGGPRPPGSRPSSRIAHVGEMSLIDAEHLLGAGGDRLDALAHLHRRCSDRVQLRGTSSSSCSETGRTRPAAPAHWRGSRGRHFSRSRSCTASRSNACDTSWPIMRRLSSRFFSTGHCSVAKKSSCPPPTTFGLDREAEAATSTPTRCGEHLGRSR